MKILHISNYYAPHVGGIEKTAEDIVDSLKNCCEQKLMCFNHEKKTVHENIDGIEIIRVGCFAKIASQSLSLRYGKILKKIFSEFIPDVVIFHFPNPFVAHYLIKILKKQRKKCKLIVWYHLDITKQKILGKFFVGQTNRLLDIAYKIIATSPNYVAGSDYLNKRIDKIKIIPSCIDEDRLRLNDAVLTAANQIRNRYINKTICFTFGRHVEYKGYKYLIDSVQYLSKDVVIVIGGCGPQTEFLKKRAEQYTDRVFFIGKISDDTLKAYLLSCDIFCFPSVTKNEAFGLALAEAMYFGKPAITFSINGSGVNYVSINNETGIEVPNSDSAAYAAAIETLTKDKALCVKYGNMARKRVETLFLKKDFALKVKSLLDFKR